MHAFRNLLVALGWVFCSGVAIAQIPTPTPGTAFASLRLSDLTFSAMSLDPAGGSAYVGFSPVIYAIDSQLLGAQEQFFIHSERESGAVPGGLFGASSRTQAAAYVVAWWNGNFGNKEYDLHANAAIEDPLSQWYRAETHFTHDAVLQASPNSMVVVSGHLEGWHSLGESEALAPEAGGFLRAELGDVHLERIFGSESGPGSLNDFFTLTIYNHSNDVLTIDWRLEAGLSASKAIPPVPEPAPVGMLLAGSLVLLAPGLRKFRGDA